MTSDGQKIADAMDYLSSIGINVIFPVMWNNGYTLYPSRIMDENFSRRISPKIKPGLDPLERLIIEAHRNGIEVIPWMEYGFASSYSTGIINDPIINKFPNWATKTSNGNICTDGKENTGFVWMSGINPEVQNFIISLVTEIADNYDIDGIQGDDRLPAMPVEGGYDSTTIAVYRSEHNGNLPPLDFKDADWKRWRAEKLNDFFIRLKDSLKIHGKNLILSSAPSPYYWGYDDHLQDSKSWANRGIVDNLIPQIYPDPPQRSFELYKWILQKTLDDIDPDKRNIFFPGILAKVGPFVITPEQIVNCVRENRANNLKGETYFFYEGVSSNNKVNGDTLKASVYNKPALLPYRNGNLWRPKAAVINPCAEQFVSLKGKWELSHGALSKYKTYLTDNKEYASAVYKVNAPASAWFSLYIHNNTSSDLTSKADYRVFSGKDTSIVTIDQSDLKNSGWIKLKDVFLNEGLNTVLEINNDNLPDNKLLNAGALMLMINRKLSPEAAVLPKQIQAESAPVIEILDKCHSCN